MSRTIDARGLSCPQPVILTTHAMSEPGAFEVLVANAVARDDLLRMLADCYGLTPEVRQTGLEITIRVDR